MLQQTRVDQALPYFQRFIGRFPTVETLAEAELGDVLVQWEGLGYYARARNLHRAARSVVRDHGGRLPQSYDGLKRLPGVGDYTAAAVGSLAFGLPEAVLDGNVIRVLARFDSVEDDVTRSGVRRHLRARGQDLLDVERPGAFNEGLMELGATICTPKSPDCGRCPVSPGCLGRAGGQPERYPHKSKRASLPEFEIAVGIVVRDDGAILIQRRPENGLLGGLWEFPGGKLEAGESPGEACIRELREELGIVVVLLDAIEPIRHAYSHFKIRLHGFVCRLASGSPTGRQGQPHRWVASEDLGDYAFPRANRRLIEALQSTTWPK